MSGMFDGANSFNGDISGWNTASVTDMSGMFVGAYSFNGDISGWNTENVTNMQYMFESASAFNQNLGNWNLSSIPAPPEENMEDDSMINMLYGTALDCNNYSLTLQGWAANLGSTTPAGIYLNETDLSYSNDAATTAATLALLPPHYL